MNPAYEIESLVE